MYNGNMKNKLPRKYRIISKVRRSDAPENIVSLRYVGMHNGVAGDAKMAKTLVRSGFAGGGGGSKPQGAFAPTVCFYPLERDLCCRLLLKLKMQYRLKSRLITVIVVPSSRNSFIASYKNFYLAGSQKLP